MIAAIEDVVAVTGGNVFLIFNVSDDSPKVSSSGISWLFNSGSTEVEIVYPGDGRRVIANDRLSITITGVVYADEGEYTLLAGNAAGVGLGTVSLDVQGVFIKCHTVKNGSLL